MIKGNNGDFKVGQMIKLNQNEQMSVSFKHEILAEPIGLEGVVKIV